MARECSRAKRRVDGAQTWLQAPKNNVFVMEVLQTQKNLHRVKLHLFLGEFLRVRLSQDEQMPRSYVRSEVAACGACVLRDGIGSGGSSEERR